MVRKKEIGKNFFFSPLVKDYWLFCPSSSYIMCLRQSKAVVYTTKKFNKPTKNTKAIQTPEPTQSSFLDSPQFWGVA
jgi:hypothetical protein